MDFYAPGFHAGIGDLNVAESQGEDAGRPLMVTRVFHCITPATRHSSYYFFANAKAGSTDGEVESLNKVIDEDVFASVEIEMLLATLEDENEPKELMIRSDHAAVEGRRMLQALMDREAEAQTV